jgi:hypothetical protein
MVMHAAYVRVRSFFPPLPVSGIAFSAILLHMLEPHPNQFVIEKPTAFQSPLPLPGGL